MSYSSEIPRKQTVQISTRLVYLVTSDSELASSLNHQIGHFGYKIHPLADPGSLERAVNEQPPQAVLVDLPSLEPAISGQGLVPAFQKLKQNAIPLIFLSDRGDQSTRLAAVRLGGTAFFTKPVNIIALVDKLEGQDALQESEPSRVLIVEDQEQAVNDYRMALVTAGMQARVVRDSAQVLDGLMDFHPDLILMSLYMLTVNGTELVMMIRQIDEFTSIPILFLSSEEDIRGHIGILDLDRDDFLTTPIQATNLVSRVRSRLERLKRQRSSIMRDSLTGLLNHTSFREVLGQEVNRCRRQRTTITLAMLDIDQFKLVNDTFGHAAGDSILKALSRLLRQRLRKSDIVGRYSSDEFVALFLDADPEQAYRVINEMRAYFQEMEFRPVPEQALSVTFSAGIASFPAFSTAKALSDAAEEALYMAKRAGRNQIIIASPDRTYLK
jgi:diguanylate cyclase (GGDEF)-like protein